MAGAGLRQEVPEDPDEPILVLLPELGGEKESDEPAQQIERAMRLVVGRPPTDDEQQAFHAFAAKHGLHNFCRVLFNLSEFVYLD